MKLSTLARWTCAAALGSAVLLGDVLPSTQTSGNFALTIGEAAEAKRSGGRSGGGSSGRSRPRRSTPSRSSDSPSRSSGWGTSPTVIVTGGGAGSAAGTWGAMLLVGGVFVAMAGMSMVSSFRKMAKTLEEGAFSETELDNDIVTVSALQVAILITDDHAVQQDLTDLSLEADTSHPAGLVAFLQAAALAVLRSSDQWCYGTGSSKTVSSRDQATACFNVHSLQERSTFGDESLSNMDGAIQQRAPIANAEQGSYVAVTFIVTTEADRSLFETIASREDLHRALVELSAMPADYLLQVEVLWTPQAAPEGLTEEELLLDYADLQPF